MSTDKSVENGSPVLPAGSTLKISSNNSGKSQYSYISIIAPKGYRITRYVFDIDTRNSTNNTMLAEYSYDKGTVKLLQNNTVTVNNSAPTLNLDITKNGNANKLYFRIDFRDQTTTGKSLILKSLKIYYIIDDVFSAQLPNVEYSDSIRTDLLYLGTFGHYNNKDAWLFYTDSISDTQEAGFYHGADGSPINKEKPSALSTDGSHYFEATNGDYYIEVPAKYRIVEASVNFLSKDVTRGGNTTVSTVSDIVSGQEYVITDGNGHYLNFNTGDLSLFVGKEAEYATKWTFTKTDKYYTISAGEQFYLTNEKDPDANRRYLTVSSSPDEYWQYSSSYGIYTTYRSGSSTYTYYHVDYENGSWKLTYDESTQVSSDIRVATVTTTGGTLMKAPSFTGTVYDRSNSNPISVTNNSADQTVKTLTLDNLNNDAIHIKISDLPADSIALFNVNLRLLPLNPEVQSLSLAAKNKDSQGVSGSTSVAAENFKFSDVILAVNGNTGGSYDVVVRNAYNDSRTKFYEEGSSDRDNDVDGYSNYFVVGSNADNGGSDKVSLDREKSPTDRDGADVVGTVGLAFSNIDELIDKKDSFLVENEFKKADAKIKEVSLTNDQSDSVYIYTADEPTFLIMPESVSHPRHIDYRYYAAMVTLKITEETAKIDITPIYTSTFKGAPHKTNGNTLTADNTTTGADKNHTYIGVKVTSNGEGYLTFQKITDALDEVLKNNSYYGFDESDPYRGILYVDMSSLKTVSDDETTSGDGSSTTKRLFDAFNEGTADNCLYFMYPTFSRADITNTISKLSNGGYEAVSNIVIKDQQPFFTPYNFSTGTHTATYTRESSLGKAAVVKQMSCILPFDLQLDNDGHPWSISENRDKDGSGSSTGTDNEVDKNITFYEITESGKSIGSLEGDEYAYKVVASPAKTKGIDSDNSDKFVANANNPYHVATTAENGGFTFNVTGARFHKTPDTINNNDGTYTESDMTLGDKWKGYGTYAGMVHPRDYSIFIFSSNYYHKTGAQKQYDNFYLVPFRAYFKTTDANAAKTNTFAVVTDENDIVTGIEDVSFGGDKNLTIRSGQGFISVTAGQPAIVNVYSIGGQRVASGSLSQGETSRYSLSQGVYVVNGVKVIVK